MNLSLAEALAAVASGETLVGGDRSEYAGMVVEYKPRKDKANNHPDYYPWHVVGRPDYARLKSFQLRIR